MYTESQLQQLIADVEKEFTAHLSKSEEMPEMKSKESPKEEEKKDAAKDSKEEPKEEKASEKESKEEPKKEETPENSPESKEKDATPDSEESHGYDDEDMEHMHGMYRSMNKAELKAHHDAVRDALDHHGMEKCEEESQAKPMEMAKSEAKLEVKAAHLQLEPQIEMLKSEIAAKNAEYAELKKNFDAVSEFLTKFTKKVVPQGKAITNLETIAKSESTEAPKALTKAEIDTVLMKKLDDSNLSKSDRDSINTFYLKGRDLTLINHLLK